MIGWYHTGPKLRASDQEINELFKRFVARPVMVIVDVRPHTVGIPTDAYFAVEEIKDVRFILYHNDKLSTDLYCRMAQKHGRHSCTFHQRLRRRRRRRLGWSICYEISKIRRPRRSPRA